MQEFVTLAAFNGPAFIWNIHRLLRFFLNFKRTLLFRFVKLDRLFHPGAASWASHVKPFAAVTAAQAKEVIGSMVLKDCGANEEDLRGMVVEYRSETSKWRLQ